MTDLDPTLDPTLDEGLRSWVETANVEGADFPIQNLPFGVFDRGEGGPEAAGRIGLAIGDQILDLYECHRNGLLDGLPSVLRAACAASDLNPLMGLERGDWRRLRAWASAVLSELGPASAIAPSLVPQAQVAMRLPARIGDYTDFYASVHHATNVGRMFRPDSPLTPNYKHLPIGYHGRASSVVASGTEVRRPRGQRAPTLGDPPVFGPSRYLDYELEMGCFVGGRENALGTPIPIAAAEDRTFGLCLLNDWSARDLQVWESQPLGPFVSKSFATSISPWVLTLEALAPFRCAALARSETDPTPLPYLTDARPSPAIDVTVEAYLSTVRMRAEGRSPFRVTRGSLSSLYWTFAQLIAHHASGGCNLRAGDLLGSGTISGAGAESLGCLLERTRRGADPLRLPGGEQRTMLEDGDEILLEAYCERPGFVRIGFGGCRGRILPAQAATRY